MSKVLMIRHLPRELSFQKKEELLKFFGAETVWQKSLKRDYVFASFANVEQAKASLTRLHQLEIDKRRLVVEYSIESEPLTPLAKDDPLCSITTNHVKEFLHRLNSWNPSVDFYQPPPAHLKYKYPEVTTKTLINIIHAMATHQPLYIQTLHLMNKMTLDIPFEDNAEAEAYFKEKFKDHFVELIPTPQSESESEISSDEIQQKEVLPTVVKRKHTLPKTRKRAAAVLSTASLPKAKRKPLNQEEVFEGVPMQESKKISVVVQRDALEKQPEQEIKVLGELGKFEKESEPVLEEQPLEEPELPTISRKEIEQNRISSKDMKLLPVFKNYHPGQPSMRLYIKNLAKAVTEQDLTRVYRRYIDKLGANDQIGFDIRVMQEGRMKGQAFVTFPAVKLAEVALNETNGYILKDKPICVQFARVANKKPIE